MAPIKKRSAIWNHFSEIDNNKAKCGYCGQVMAIPNKSVGNLNRHMKLKHPTIKLQIERQDIPNCPPLESSLLAPSPPPAASVASLPSTSRAPQLTISSIQSTLSEFIDIPPASSLPSSSRAPPSVPQVSQLPVSSVQSTIQSTLSEYIHKPIPLKKSMEIDKQILKLLVKNYHPFSLVDQEEFKALLLIHDYSWVQTATRKTLPNSILLKYYLPTVH